MGAPRAGRKGRGGEGRPGPLPRVSARGSGQVPRVCGPALSAHRSAECTPARPQPPGCSGTSGTPQGRPGDCAWGGVSPKNAEFPELDPAVSATQPGLPGEAPLF